MMTGLLVMSFVSITITIFFPLIVGIVLSFAVFRYKFKSISTRNLSIHRAMVGNRKQHEMVAKNICNICNLSFPLFMSYHACHMHKMVFLLPLL